jgi:hypothetical protein
MVAGKSFVSEVGLKHYAALIYHFYAQQRTVIYHKELLDKLLLSQDSRTFSWVETSLAKLLPGKLNRKITVITNHDIPHTEVERSSWLDQIPSYSTTDNETD